MRSHSPSDPPARRGRPRRYQIDAIVRVESRRGWTEARARNLSEQGVGFETDVALPDSEVALKLPGLPVHHGHVRWRTDGKAGVEFARPISPEHLRAWLAAHGGKAR